METPKYRLYVIYERGDNDVGVLGVIASSPGRAKMKGMYEMGIDDYIKVGCNVWKKNLDKIDLSMERVIEDKEGEMIGMYREY